MDKDSFIEFAQSLAEDAEWLAINDIADDEIMSRIELTLMCTASSVGLRAIVHPTDS